MTLRGSQKDGEGSREYFGQVLCFDTLPALLLANTIVVVRGSDGMRLTPLVRVVLEDL